MDALNLTFKENLSGLLLDENLSTASLSSGDNQTQNAQSVAITLTELSNEPPISSAENTFVSTIETISSSTTAENIRVGVSETSQQRPDLMGRLYNIQLPDTMDYGDLGQVTLKILNKGNAIAQGSVKIKLYLSTDGKIDSNDVVLTTQDADININPGQSSSITINYNNITSAVAPGAYRIIAKIDSDNSIVEKNENNNLTSQLVSAPGTDMVIDWNAAALNAIMAEGVAGRGVPPTLGSRLLAIMSNAMYETAQVLTENPVAGVNLEAAIAGSAYQVLKTLLPRQAYTLGQQMFGCLKEIKGNKTDEARGVSFGQEIANQVMASRANDGSNDNTPYTPPSGDYVWRPDAPNFTAVGPNWGRVTPFAISSVEEFSPDGLDGTPTNDPVRYAREIEEVRLVGGRNNTDLTTITRTADQTEIAVFWAYDRADTFRPYGQLNQIAQEVAVREGNSLTENLSLFASLHYALADAAIVAWNAKYTYTQPRPDDVIAGGIAANDGIASTVGDPNWRPLLDTPPFPDYISGHSIFGGAWAGVMSHFFGEDYEFTAVSQELPGVTRSFDSFYEAAFEDTISRVYGGIHVREATVTDALPTGIEIGQYVAENFFPTLG